MNLPEFDQARHERMEREHAAWLDVVAELKLRGIIDINVHRDGEGQPTRDGKDVELIHAITKWGEELAQLRLNDPQPEHAGNALAEKRERYPGQWERGTYPES